jgi:hypothetical protein
VGEQDFKDRKYEEVFEQVCAQCELRRREDPQFTPAALRRLLEAAYHRQGVDWTGKGPLNFLIQSATIAAYEHVLAEWEARHRDEPADEAPRS